MKKLILAIISVLLYPAIALAENPVVRLDSIVTPGSDKVEYIYNSQNQVSEALFLTWDDIHSCWEADTKNERTYNADGTLAEVKILEYIYGQWYFACKYIYSYNSDGTIAQGVLYTPHGEAFGREEFSYNEQRQIMQVLFYAPMDAEVAESRMDYSYDEWGNNTTQTYYDWEDDEWVIDETITFTYDNDTSTTEGTKKITKCIYTEEGIETETFYHYSELAPADITTIGDNKSPSREFYDLTGAKVVNPQKDQLIITRSGKLIIRH